MSKNHNPNHAKIHRSYTVEEVAILYDVHKNTVRSWIKDHGLNTIDDNRPLLILGSDLRGFLQVRRSKNKSKCLPHEIYCLKCRKPQVPAGNMADFIPMTESTGRLIGLCPECESPINKYFSPCKIETLKGLLSVSPLQKPEGIKTHNLVR